MIRLSRTNTATAAVDRFPVDACGLHAHQRNSKRGQPVPQLQKPPGGGGELPNLQERLTTFTRSPHARGDRGLVHIQPRTPFDDPLQPFSLLLRGTLCVAYWKPLSIERVWCSCSKGNSLGCLRLPRQTWESGSCGTKQSRRQLKATTPFSWLRGGPARAMIHLGE